MDGLYNLSDWQNVHNENFSDRNERIEKELDYEVDKDIDNNSSNDQPRDYYSILNIPRDATTEVIKERYKQLAIIFHPDKQRDERNKEIASNQFFKIQEAYEVLSNEQKRMIYDTLGEEGLKNIDLQVGQRLQSPQEMREEFERRRRLNELESLESVLRSKGEVNCHLDATKAVANLMQVQPKVETNFLGNPVLENTNLTSQMAGVTVRRLVMQHSFECPISRQTQLVVLGQMVSKGNAGGGNVLGTVRHFYSPKLTFNVR